MSSRYGDEPPCHDISDCNRLTLFEVMLFHACYILFRCWIRLAQIDDSSCRAHFCCRPILCSRSEAGEAASVAARRGLVSGTVAGIALGRRFGTHGKAHLHVVRVGEFAWTAMEPHEGR